MLENDVHVLDVAIGMSMVQLMTLIITIVEYVFLSDIRHQNPIYWYSIFVCDLCALWHSYRHATCVNF